MSAVLELPSGQSECQAADLHVHVVRSAAELAGLAARWDALSAGVPFCSYAWHSLWWKHYADDRDWAASRSLNVVVVRNADGLIVGIAPWYVETRPLLGRTLHWLGSGEVCTDHQTILCESGYEMAVAERLADCLAPARGRAAPGDELQWDVLDIDGVLTCDAPVWYLLEALAVRGCLREDRPVPNLWCVTLPSSWEEYEKRLSKGHRHEIRRYYKRLGESAEFRHCCVESVADFDLGWSLFVDLHQRRRRSLGESGCFANPRFAGFQREFALEQLRLGNLRLAWLEINGRPAAVECIFVGERAFYLYQSGMDPEMRKYSPGRLLNATLIRETIARGLLGYDMLRGDEPYKRHWKAHALQLCRTRITRDRPRDRLRHACWRARATLARLWRAWRQPAPAHDSSGAEAGGADAD